MGPGAWLLGTTARHSEMKPDAEEGGRKRGPGVRWYIQGLGVSVAQAARTPGGPGVCGGSWWRFLSGCSDPNPPRGRLSGWKPGWGGQGLPYSESPRTCFHSWGYSLSGTPEFKQSPRLGLEQGWREYVIQHCSLAQGPWDLLGHQPALASSLTLTREGTAAEKAQAEGSRLLRLWDTLSPSRGFMFCVYKMRQITLPLNVFIDS